MMVLVSPVFSQSLDFLFSESLTVDETSGFFDKTGFSMLFNYHWFDLAMDIRYTNDGKYEPEEARWTGSHYLFPGQNYISAAVSPFRFEFGRLDPQSVLDTPYSLYISSNEITSLGARLEFDGDFFFYRTQWIQLNFNSEMEYEAGIDTDPADTDYWRDRGANHKTWGIRLGDFLFGFQDSSVYLDKSFDPEYFASPLPQFLTQLFRTHGGKPWSEQNNENILMGFFCQYNPADWYAYGQLLVDDINASFVPGVDADNLSKMAWSAGVEWDSPYGGLAFYTAGATKYTFEATYSDSDSYSLMPYEYTYYPATEFPFSSGPDHVLWYYDNYIGYKYGENNLAFNLTYKNTFLKDDPWEFSIDGGLEWVINGSKSPANPWHEYQSWLEIDVPAEWLNDPVLENILRMNVHAEKKIWKFNIFLDLELGYVWNGLLLEEIDPDEPKRFVPSAGNNFPLYSVGLGVLFDWDLF